MARGKAKNPANLKKPAQQGKEPANRISEIREKRGIAQRRLAQLIGVTPPTMEKLENRKQGLTYSYMQRMAEALDVHPAEFMLETPRPFPSVAELQLLARYRGLTPESRQAVTHIIETMAEPTPPAAQGASPPSAAQVDYLPTKKQPPVV